MQITVMIQCKLLPMYLSLSGAIQQGPYAEVSPVLLGGWDMEVLPAGDEAGNGLHGAGGQKWRSVILSVKINLVPFISVLII